MTALQVVEFDHDTRVAREYMDLIGRVHADDPEWIAPLSSIARIP